MAGQVFVVADRDTNSLLITTATKYQERVMQIVTELDRPVPQVLIKVLIAEISEDGSEHRLFRVTYDGTLYDERKFVAIGGKAEQLAEALADLLAAIEKNEKRKQEQAAEGLEYARTGQTRTLDVAPGLISAKVQGRMPRAYPVARTTAS